MISFPADYKIRTERNMLDNAPIYECLCGLQRQLSHACIDMGWDNEGQIVDSMFTKRYNLSRVYDIDGVKKYKITSGINPFFIERQDLIEMADDLFRKRNTPLMHIKYAVYSIMNPPTGMSMLVTAYLAIRELPENLKMCRLNKTR